MFAYCNNNPVALEDSTGDSATIAGGIVGGILGLISAYQSERKDDNEGGPIGIRWDKVWKCAVSSAVAGAAAGFSADLSIATCGVVPAIFISAGGGFFASFTNSLYTQHTLSGSTDLKKATSDGLLGGLTNGLCTGVSDAFEPVAKELKAGLDYVNTQITTELIPGAVDAGKFLINDLLPTLITGFGAWYGGMKYDIITG